MLPKCLSVLLVLIFVPIGVSKSQSLNYILDICVLFVGIEKIIVTNIYIYYVRFCRSGFIRHFPNGHSQPNGIDLNPKCPFDVSMSYEHEQLNTHPHPTTSILLHAVFLTVPQYNSRSFILRVLVNHTWNPCWLLTPNKFDDDSGCALLFK